MKGLRKVMEYLQKAGTRMSRLSFAKPSANTWTFTRNEGLREKVDCETLLSASFQNVLSCTGRKIDNEPGECEANELHLDELEWSIV